ncbi:3-hydroxyacyl-CoA dehydrogenase [Mesorhizobium sp. CU2]|nr:3-hydroxyacyl-CoA dehydrogenase [Mesorhizobium sp. CU3]TPO12796.1 3-hydroxyacyl-CoA dehydrogenase [Mesorhizobium sp. CU2]
MTVTWELRDRIAVIIIANPPVNALGKAVRERLATLVHDLDADTSIDAVVLAGAGKLFVGGADITEFDGPVEAPLPELIAAIEGSAKPWVAAIHGVALGGGLELALGCRFRVAAPGATLGLPEVNLGLIPGAGGTQRLPRLIGTETAVAVAVEKLTLDTFRAMKVGLVDRVIDGPLVDGAVSFAKEALARPLPPPASARNAAAVDWDAADARIRKAAKGLSAPPAALAALRHGIEHGFAAGIALERETFLRLRASEESAALRHLFFAERAAPRPADLRQVSPKPIAKVGVVGGGTMGSGIAAALRGAGLAVTLSERDEDALARGMATLSGIFDAAVKRGLVSVAETTERFAGVDGKVGLESLRDCDLVIEAVFEDLAVKQDVFAELGRICRPDAILATNTSYIDPREIARSLQNPGRFLGLHFFSPAQVMKLLEIIPTPDTTPETLATAFDLARRLGKVPVRSGICDGFIGNRILRRYRGEAEILVRQGLSVAAIDSAMRAFGFAMGPFEVQDLSGLDISFMQREAARARGEEVAIQPGDLLVRAGRKGQKTGGGWYDYVAGDRTPRPSDTAAKIIAPLVQGQGDLAADKIAERLVGAMAAEGEAILAEGIAASPADIDLVEVHGYGFPRSKGGPMFLTARKASST